MKANFMRATQTFAGPGSFALDAEMQVEKDNGTIVYLHANYFDGDHYTSAAGSIFDYMTKDGVEDPDVKFVEEYDSLRAAKKSPYYPGFKALSTFASHYQKWRKTEGNEGALTVENPEVTFV